MRRTIYVFFTAMLALLLTSTPVQAQNLEKQHIRVKLANDIYANTEYLVDYYKALDFEDETSLGYHIIEKSTNEIVETISVEKNDSLVKKVNSDKLLLENLTYSGGIVPLASGTYWTTLRRTFYVDRVDVTVVVHAQVYYWNSYRSFTAVGDRTLQTSYSQVDLVGTVLTAIIDPNLASNLFTRSETQLRTTNSWAISSGWLVGGGIGGNIYYYKYFGPKETTFSLY